MKHNKFLVAIISATITSGALIFSIPSVQASSPDQNKTDSIETIKPGNIFTTVGGSAVLGGFILSCVYLFNYSREDKSNNVDKAVSNETLGLPVVPEIKSELEKVGSRN